ncbi:MAG TPA: histidine kinase, partial [Gaiellaceae bacterium]|nr:histidine kinase [Gaiellaceae bacterium]
MSDLGPLVRRYGFDALIVLAAIVIALEGAFRDGADPPTTTRWFTVPALALIVLPLLLRRRFPFAAPAAVWVIAAGCAVVDGRLVVFSVISSVAGMIAAFLLGNLRDETQARLGLAVVVSGAAIVIYSNPKHAPGELVFVPVLFAIGWLAGYALRERAAQVEQAEERALEAEFKRESAARLAVAEERARIARELHDVVAHAVSVMVLQVGAVRHNLPEELAADSDALKDVEL